MALTNRHRLSILIGFLVISEIFYITLMIKLPDDIMQREKAQNFVEQVGKYIPKIANLQKLAERDVVPEVMPFFYAVVCLWCLSVGSVTSFICLLKYSVGNYLKKEGKFNSTKDMFVIIGGLLFFGDGFFISPFNVDSQIGVLYVPRPTAAGFGAIMNTFLYLIFLMAVFRAYPVVKYYTVRGDNV